MKYLTSFILLILLTTSCHITETIIMNPDGSGTIEIYSLRDENSVQQMGRNNFGFEKFRDTTFSFRDYIAKYQETFVKFNKADQAIFQEHANVKMQIKVDPVLMENFNKVSFDFRKLEEIPDVYESLDLANSLKQNYPIETNFYKIKYSFDGSIFKRSIIITNQEKFDQEKKEITERQKMLSKYKVLQLYTLQYHFPRKIKSVSNEKAIFSADKKSLTLEFQLLDCLQNPEHTNLEVVLE